VNSIIKRRSSVSVVVAMVFLAALPAASRGWKTPPRLEIGHMPQLCEWIDGTPASKFRLPGPMAEDWPVFLVIWEEHEFRVALDPETFRVRALSTEDPAFRTPEGVGLGSTLQEARERSAGEVRCGSGWTCFARLPSGWNAGFSTVYSNPETQKIEYREPVDEAPVSRLVLHGECEDRPGN
jgi:hypothetical protein